MKIITLPVVDSTNDFLKNYIRDQNAESFIIVRAIEQTHGKGQMGNLWLSENDKNLTFSFLLKNPVIKIEDQFIITALTSIAVAESLKELNIENLSIKWPNDIMIGNKKTAGILIEILYKSNNEYDVIVGIGLNVNQHLFPNLPHATSLAIETQKEFDLETVMKVIVQKMMDLMQKSNPENHLHFLHLYNQMLFKINKPAAFKNSDGTTFMGIIKEVSSDGKIHILNKNDQIESFSNKEIAFLISH